MHLFHLSVRYIPYNKPVIACKLLSLSSVSQFSNLSNLRRQTLRLDSQWCQKYRWQPGLATGVWSGDIVWDWVEPLICGVCVNPRQVMSELNWIAGHPAGVRQCVGVGQNPAICCQKCFVGRNRSSLNLGWSAEMADSNIVLNLLVVQSAWKRHHYLEGTFRFPAFSEHCYSMATSEVWLLASWLPRSQQAAFRVFQWLMGFLEHHTGIRK